MQADVTQQSTLGPSIWAVSDGRAGNAAQVRAIVQALSETRRWMQIAHIAGQGHRPDAITLHPRAPWTWLPSAHWPMPRQALPTAERAMLTPPWPSLWIAAGRRSAPYTAALRNWSGKTSLCVQILDPKMDPALFDLIIVPEHDGLHGPNIGSPPQGAPRLASSPACAPSRTGSAAISGPAHRTAPIPILVGCSFRLPRLSPRTAPICSAMPRGTAYRSISRGSAAKQQSLTGYTKA